MSANGDDDMSARATYHAELLRQREQRGWSLSELSDRTKYDASYLQRLEKGGRLGSLDAAGVLDRTYGTGGLLSRLWRLAKKESSENRYEGFMDLAAEAGVIQEFSVSTVPGLLQTRGYAEAQLRTDEPETEELLAEQVTNRISRQERLSSPRPLNYRCLLDESVIRRPAGEPAVWIEQLEHLIEMAQRPNVSLHIVPFSAGLHNLLGGSLTLLWLPSGRTAAYLEDSRFGHMVEETEEIDRLRLYYDRLRDFALTASESLSLLRATLEEYKSCSPPRPI